MGVFDEQMTDWFNEMHALSPVAVVFEGESLRGVQDESQDVLALIAGGVQEQISGYVIVLKSECGANLPGKKKPITIDGRDCRVVDVHTEPADPTLRIVYGNR